MNKVNNKPEVYIVGGDHHNTLAAIRSLGYKKVEFKVLVHGTFKTKKDIRIAHSKYCKSIDYIDENEEDILSWLITNTSDKKVIVIPCSDLAEYVIDNNYLRLKEKYIIPGFMNNPGKVVKMMDKYEQKLWADKNGIPMAKTWSISLIDNETSVPEDIEYPCIIKPEISAKGNKSDIKICYNGTELKNELREYEIKKYKNVLIQKFLIKKYEICAFGCVLNDKEKYIGKIIKKNREYPAKGGGSLAFAHFTKKIELKDFIDNIIYKLHEEGYIGLYDIEALVCEDGIYLNEMNFRHSGNGYSILKYGINIVYSNYMDLLSKEYICNDVARDNFYFMDEVNELKLLLNKDISFKTYISDLLKCKSFSRMSFKDIKGSLAFIYVPLKKKIVSKLEGIKNV